MNQRFCIATSAKVDASKADASKVDDKNKGQCYNHHKLLSILEAEEAERQKKAAKNKKKSQKKKKADKCTEEGPRSESSGGTDAQTESKVDDIAGAPQTTEADALALETLKMYGK